MRRLRFLGLTAWLVLASLSFLGSPHGASACSCVSSDLRSIVSAANLVVVEGQVLGRDGDGVRVAVDRWYAGSSHAPVVRLAGVFDSPGVSNSCSIALPVEGSAWVWAASTDEHGDLVVANCYPQEEVLGPSNALRDEAVAAFGPGWAPTAIVPDASGPLPILVAMIAVALAALLSLGWIGR